MQRDHQRLFTRNDESYFATLRQNFERRLETTVKWELLLFTPIHVQPFNKHTVY